MRSFIRHPADIPIVCEMESTQSAWGQRLKNVSHGGLAFSSKHPVALGAEIKVRIPGIEQGFEITGQVTWCRRDPVGYSIGIQFLDADDSFRARMVEQVCHIEHYKAEVARTEGRELSGEEAAEEWISKFAKDFPDV